MQLGTVVRSKNYVPESSGIISLSYSQWLQLVEELFQVYHNGWSKEYRETKPIDVLAQELLSYGSQWMLLREQADEVWLLPQLARFSGEYNDDFNKKEQLDEK